MHSPPGRGTISGADMPQGEEYMRLVAIAAIGLLAGLLALGVSARAEDASTPIGNIGKQWEATYNSGDAAKLAALYAEDATFSSGVLGVLHGRAEIEKAVANIMKTMPKIVI